MASSLQRHLHVLKEEIVALGAAAEDAVARAVLALNTRDTRLAQQVIDADAEIDRMELMVEEECLQILALHQPVALDLRFVVATLKINNDLERIGDLAKNIAKRVVQLSAVHDIDIPDEFTPMARYAQQMVKHSLDSLVTANAPLARQVRLDDDRVDDIRDTIEDTLRAYIALYPEKTEAFLKLSSVARHLERLGDMATHIAEEVIYMVEGHVVRHRAGA
jgi:phosphate transport system protein